MLGSSLDTWHRCLLMETFLYLVTLLVLLRVAHVKYPPLLHQWSLHGLSDLFDLHDVMCLVTHGDVLSRKTLECLWNQYDWWSLCRGLTLVKHMWFHYGSCAELASTCWVPKKTCLKRVHYNLMMVPNKITNWRPQSRANTIENATSICFRQITNAVRVGDFTDASVCNLPKSAGP